VAWLTIHIYFLIGFRNRLAVLFEWVWSYFTFTYGARLITGSHDLPGWNDLTSRKPEPEAARLETAAPGARAAS